MAVNITENLHCAADNLTLVDYELACFYVVRHLLHSHKLLSLADIHYAANYISSFYAHSQRLIEGNPDATNVLSDTLLTRLLVYINQCSIGKFALIYNEAIDNAILTRNNVLLRELLLSPKEVFVELYDNPYLLAEDRDYLLRIISREMYAMLLVLGRLRKQLINNDLIDLEGLATNCFNEICIHDSRILTEDLARGEMFKYEKLSPTIYTVDKGSTTLSPQVYCFDTMKLIGIMTERVPINPSTREPFSDFSRELIQQRLRKEIALYKRYKELKGRY